MLVSDVLRSKPVIYIHIYPLFVFSHIGWEMEYSCHTSKQGCVTVMSNFDPPNVNFWALRGIRKQNNTCDLAAMRLQPLPTVSIRELRMWNTQDTGPRELRGIWRKDLSEPRLLRLPAHRTVLRSLTWGIWLSLIQKNAFNIQTTCPLLEDFYVTWLSPPHSSEQFSQGYWRCCLRLEVLKIPTE